MSIALRIIIWFFGSLMWIFWMYLAFASDFLGMVSDGDADAPYSVRFFFSRISIEKTPKNKKRILLCLDLFGVAIISILCFCT